MTYVLQSYFIFQLFYQIYLPLTWWFCKHGKFGSTSGICTWIISIWMTMKKSNILTVLVISGFILVLRVYLKPFTRNPLFLQPKCLHCKAEEDKGFTKRLPHFIIIGAKKCGTCKYLEVIRTCHRLCGDEVFIWGILRCAFLLQLQKSEIWRCRTGVDGPNWPRSTYFCIYVLWALALVQQCQNLGLSWEILALLDLTNVILLDI